MDWLTKLLQLPVIIETAESYQNPENFIKEYIGSVCVIASHIYLPIAGAVFQILIKGPAEERLHVLDEINCQLKDPLDPPPQDPKNIYWKFLWRSPCKEIPETKFHRVVGRDVIREICQKQGLDERLEKLVDECLAIMAYEYLSEEKRKIFVRFRISKELSQIQAKIVVILGDIILRFFAKRLE